MKFIKHLVSAVLASTLINAQAITVVASPDLPASASVPELTTTVVLTTSNDDVFKHGHGHIPGIPEPATYGMMLVGLLGIALFTRKRVK